MSWTWEMMNTAPFDFFISEGEEENNVFITLARTTEPGVFVVPQDDDEESTPAFTSPSSDMLNVCKCVAV